MDTRLYALGGSRPTSPSPSETAVEAYFIPGWTVSTCCGRNAVTAHLTNDNTNCGPPPLSDRTKPAEPWWVQTVTRMPDFSVNMGQSAGVYNGDSMFVVAGTYTAAAGLPAMKYTASTDAWAIGTLAPREASLIARSVRIPPVCTWLQ